MICKTPCVAEYRRKYNAGNSSSCFIEALEYKREMKLNKVRENTKNMKEFVSEEKVKNTVTELAKRINEDYTSIHLVGLLKGFFMMGQFFMLFY